MALHRDLRQGDTLAVCVGRSELCAGKQDSGPTLYLHATDATISAMRIGGSTGVHSVVAPPPESTAKAAEGDEGEGGAESEGEEEGEAEGDEAEDEGGAEHCRNVTGDASGYAAQMTADTTADMAEHTSSSSQHCRERFAVFSG